MDPLQFVHQLVDAYITDYLPADSTTNEQVSTVISESTTETVGAGFWESPTGGGYWNLDLPTFQKTPTVAASMATAVAAEAARQAGSGGGGGMSGFDAATSSIDSVVYNVVTPYTLVCVAMAVLLNRTMVFATTRQAARIPRLLLVVIRAIAVSRLVAVSLPIARALKLMDPDGVGRWIPSILTELPLARALGDKAGTNSDDGSMYWEFYKAVCLGYFVETLCSALEHRRPYTETGMTLFEYSVTLQRAQAARGTTTGVLVLCALSACSHIALHVQGLLGAHKYRLIPSSVFALAFLQYFGSTLLRGSGAREFPFVCYVGYLPQLITLAIVAVCLAIYGFACLVAGGPRHVENSWFGVDIDTGDDFYTALMKFGDVALTSAASATVCAEAPEFRMPQTTWVEAEAAKAVARRVKSTQKHQRQQQTPNPYAHEVDAAVPADGHRRQDPPPSTMDHGGRLVYRRPVAAARMLARLAALLVMPVVTRVSRAFGRNRVATAAAGASGAYEQHGSTAGFAHGPIEHLQVAAVNYALYHELDDDIDGRGHARLLEGSILPSVDDSPDWEPHGDDVDSPYDGYEYDSDYSTDTEDVLSDSGESGDVYDSYVESVARQRRPPTPGTTGTTATAASTARRPSRLDDFNELWHSTPDDLMSLVAPTTTEEAAENAILAGHLRRKDAGPLTRAQFQREQPEDARDVAAVIAELRRAPIATSDDGTIPETVCVVCHASPREVILWPCRCFALCNDCRSTLATKRFKGCVCCRRPITSFSRIYVP